MFDAHIFFLGDIIDIVPYIKDMLHMLSLEMSMPNLPISRKDTYFYIYLLI